MEKRSWEPLTAVQVFQFADFENVISPEKKYTNETEEWERMNFTSMVRAGNDCANFGFEAAKTFFSAQPQPIGWMRASEMTTKQTERLNQSKFISFMSFNFLLSRAWVSRWWWREIGQEANVLIIWVEFFALCEALVVNWLQWNGMGMPD